MKAIVNTNLKKEVDRILWEEWDPIGVNNSEEARSEYRGYVPSILNLLEEGADESKIAKLLHQHANVSMGLSTQLDVHKGMAKRLRGLIL